MDRDSAVTCTGTEDLDKALAVGRGDLVSLVGGGGKTTAMYRLASRLHQSGLRVAAATTTKIARPGEDDGALLLCAQEWGELCGRLAAWDWSGPIPVLGSRLLSAVKVDGIPPEWCGRLLREGLVEALVVEADGAARRPVKAPEEWEPVVPGDTTCFVAVLGLSCAGSPLSQEIAFRTERISGVTGLALGSPLTPESLATLLTSGEGLLKGCPPGARRIALLNQADLPGARTAGREVAAEVLGRTSAVERVVITSLANPGETLEIWQA